MALQVRTQYGDLYMADALPSIYEVMQDEFRLYPDMIPQLYNVKGSSRGIEQSTTITGFGRFVQTSEGQPFNSDIAYQRFDKTYTHLKYTLSYSVSREMIDDDEFGIVNKFSRSMAKSAVKTRQILASDLFNEAFSATNFTGGDGLELCSTSHTLVAGTENNELSTSADLSITSLRQALVDIAETVDERGDLLMLTARTLLVPAELIWDAIEITKSNLRADTANNAVNAFQMDGMLSPMKWTYLTDPDAWFVICDQHDLNWFDRKPLETESYDDYKTQSMVVQSSFRCSRGWNDWRGIFGSPGA
jgi:hypothetical protein